MGAVAGKYQVRLNWKPAFNATSYHVNRSEVSGGPYSVVANTDVNARTENIGARRLHTVMEKLLEDLSFKAPELGGRSIRIDRAEVDAALTDIVQDQDLSRYIL